MKTLGIVAEYNPFHNGHLYHLRQSRALSGADCVIAVMSGNYTQRGEPALVDKWARAEMALLCGIDLVIELPFTYAMGSAEYFAFGAVKLLDSLGAVDSLCFGSESGSLEKLMEAASILADEPDGYKLALKQELAAGRSFPAARQSALSSYLKAQYDRDDLSDVLDSANNILGIEYLKALRRLKSSIRPLTLERIGNQYHSAELTGELSSATSIRRIIAENPWREAKKQLAVTLPGTVLSILEREFELGRGPVLPTDFDMLLLSLLRRMTVEEIAALPYMEEGLENRFKSAAENAGSFDELLKAVCTRRYTCTRIQRILFSLMTGLTVDLFNFFNETGGPAYIRILGFNDTGRLLLSTVRDRTKLPLITKAADFRNSDIRGIAGQLRLEAAASDQYVLGFKNPAFRKSGSEFTRNVINIAKTVGS